MASATPTPDGWRAVDRYFADTLVGHDPALEAAVGKFLHLLARISGARRVLEIGTLGGYSTIWLARGVPDDGRVVTIEAEPANAAVARANLDRAGVGEKVDIRVGRGEHVLPQLAGEEPFDLVFIDADKESNALYLDWAARLGRAGTVIVVDNVGRGGAVADAGETAPHVVGTRRGLEMLGDDPRFEATALQTLDAKGWDGVALAVVVRPGSVS
jgi:predicted O-methyltransferase YrrM